MMYNLYKDAPANARTRLYVNQSIRIDFPRKLRTKNEYGASRVLGRIQKHDVDRVWHFHRPARDVVQ